jgi:hypothetical protein
MESKYIKDFTRDNEHIKINLGIIDNDNINEIEETKQIKTNPDIEEVNINLDQNTKSQLTLKYIKSQNKTFWSAAPNLLKKLYENEDENAEKIKEIGDKFAVQILKEMDSAKDGDETFIVSAAGMFAPRTSSQYDKKHRNTRIARYIAFKIYYETGKVKEELHAIVQYTRLISLLSKIYVKQYIKNYLDNNKHKLLRILDHDKRNWCELKKKKLSCAITQPAAMEVEIAEYDELKDFFDYLKSDGDIAVNSVRVEPCMEFKRGALYEDKRMDLCKQVVGPTHIGSLMNSLETNNQVEHFLLGNNIIGTVGGEEIGKYLEKRHNMKTWYLAGNNLDSEGIKPIVDGLLNDTVCEQLWLKRNPLKAAGIKEIARLMKVNKTIKILDLQNTAVFDEGLIYLMSSLKSNRTLDYLYLDGNGITEHGAEPIVDYFKYLKENNLKGITSLWIGMNKLFDDGVEKIVKELKDYKLLERFCVCSNGLTEKCIDTIVDSFVNHPSLIVLDLGMYKATGDLGMITNNIGDEGIKKLAPLIENNKKIKFMSVLMNGITADGLDQVVESIEKNDSMLYFEYRQYNINYDGKKYNRIRTKLEENKKNEGSSLLPLRTLKHGENVKYVNSIYRNNSK